MLVELWGIQNYFNVTSSMESYQKIGKIGNSYHQYGSVAELIIFSFFIILETCWVVMRGFITLLKDTYQMICKSHEGSSTESGLSATSSSSLQMACIKDYQEGSDGSACCSMAHRQIARTSV